jgi:RimJ/RimL family protein N-acetyltransferase
MTKRCWRPEEQSSTDKTGKLMADIFLETSRLVLKPICIADAPFVFAYRSEAIVNRYQGWIPSSLADVYEFIDSWVAKQINLPDSWFQLVINLKNSGELIGDVGIHFLKDKYSEVELGITLAEAHHGKGYASEALRVVINFLSDEHGKTRFCASIDPRNESSIKLFSRLGFKRETLIEESFSRFQI